MKNNAHNNGKQPKSRKLPGGVTGRGFKPGRSGNPLGRPRTRGLVNALRAALAEDLPDGRTVEEALADALIEEGLSGKHRLAAITSIYDRIEGRPRQSLDLHDTRCEMQEDVAKMTDEELVEGLRAEVAKFDAAKNERSVADD